jgi:hypothetical protein
VSITTVVQIAQIFGPSAIGLGVLIGVVQLREFQRQRREAAAVELVTSFRNAEFNRALRLIWSLPDAVEPELLRGGDAELEDAAVLIGTTIETVGVLVYRRIVPIAVLDDLLGDAIVRFWVKLAPWVTHLRREQGRESVYEWFQWLVERLQERERRTTVGAHVKYRSWRA